MDLKDLTLALIADSKKARATAKRKHPKGRRPSATVAEPAFPTPPPDPWTRTAVVLMTIHTTCKACGSTSVAWEPHLYLEMFRGSRKRGTYCRRVERITSYTGKWAELYASLPKRIEPRAQESEACPWCFGIDYNHTSGVHCTDPLPLQLNLNLTELPHEKLS